MDISTLFANFSEVEPIIKYGYINLAQVFVSNYKD